MSSGKVIVGIVAGAAIGAALGVLYAPDMGSKTRKKIVAQKDAYVTGLEDRFNEFVATVASRFESLKNETMHKVDNGKALVNDGLAKSNVSVK